MPAPTFTIPAPEGRADILMGLRRRKMARSAHAYVRGSTIKFYEWLEASGGSLPEGPPVWICGDCHVGNLGPLADADGHVDVQIRDLDQTVIGNPAHDLIRLGLSLASAARGSNLPGGTTAHMIEDMVEGYGAALAGEAEAAKPKPKLVKGLLREAAKRKWRHLAQERIQDIRPEIPLGRTFWTLSGTERDDLATLFTGDVVRDMVLGLNHRDAGDEVALLDAAYWVKGCSSLGRLRYAALIGIGPKGRKPERVCLFDIKEGVQAAAPRSATAKMPRENAERVVAGARALSPNLGERMLATRFGERSVVLRELMPQDLKIEADRLSREEAVTVSRYLAGIVGRAHGRQMDDATRAAWLADLGRGRSKTLDAPSWLWTSVVELVASHEAAYLDHCRRYALAA